MASLFEITSDLRLIINELEENGGELTEELATALDITKENFEQKIEDYCQAITMYNSEVECCKEEKERVNNIQKVKKNIVERLKSKLLDAVKEFGYTGKSGNKIIELSTRKLFTKSTSSVEENESRKGKLTYYFLSYIKELQREGILELGENIDVNGLLASINALAKADYEMPDEFDRTPVEEFIPYTIADLQSINLEISKKVSLYNLITTDSKIGYIVASEELYPDTTSIDKDVAKAILKDDASRITVGELVSKDSLIIK